MRARRGREAFPTNQEAFLPQIWVQDPILSEPQQEVTFGVTLQQFNLLL